MIRVLACWLCLTAAAVAADDYVPQPGEFPPPDAGHYFAGELVAVDHVNRRGAIRLVGDNTSDRYHRAPSHRFALLPYGTVRYHGAAAELRDLPIGTLLHGYFVLPPEGDTTIAPPDKSVQKYVPEYTHALSLEDDFSFYQRQKQHWQVQAISLTYESSSEGDWRQMPIYAGSVRAKLIGEGNADGGEREFTIDRSTRLWQGRQQVAWEDLATADAWTTDNNVRRYEPKDLAVQMNFTWAPDWQNGQLHVTDLWLDDESRQLAAETQRQVHLRHMRHRWLPGWVDHVEHQSQGEGIVTFTLFAGLDESLYDAVREQGERHGGGAIACGEWTLRTWWQEHDNKGGQLVDVQDLPDPPTGSSGVQVRIQIRELLEGFRPGRIVRFRLSGFPNVKLPPEERVKGMTERIPPPYTTP